LCSDNIKLLRKFALCQDFSTKVSFTFLFIYINALIEILAKFINNLLRKSSSYTKKYRTLHVVFVISTYNSIFIHRLSTIFLKSIPKKYEDIMNTFKMNTVCSRFKLSFAKFYSSFKVLGRFVCNTQKKSH